MLTSYLPHAISPSTHSHTLAHTLSHMQRLSRLYANGSEPLSQSEADDEDGTIPAHEMARRLVGIESLSLLVLHIPLLPLLSYTHTHTHTHTHSHSQI